jgi:universal stress protein A
MTTATRPFENILCATDFSSEAEHALQYGATLALETGGRLTVLHVCQQPDYIRPDLSVALEKGAGHAGESFREYSERDARRRSAELVALLPTALVERTRVQTLFGNPAQSIIEYAEHNRCDLIVMGTHGWTKIAHFVLGSVAERVVRHAPCPVLIVRASQT